VLLENRISRCNYLILNLLIFWLPIATPSVRAQQITARAAFEEFYRPFLTDLESAFGTANYSVERTGGGSPTALKFDVRFNYPREEYVEILRNGAATIDITSPNYSFSFIRDKEKNLLNSLVLHDPNLESSTHRPSGFLLDLFGIQNSAMSFDELLRDSKVQFLEFGIFSYKGAEVRRLVCEYTPPFGNWSFPKLRTEILFSPHDGTLLFKRETNASEKLTYEKVLTVTYSSDSSGIFVDRMVYLSKTDNTRLDYKIKRSPKTELLTEAECMVSNYGFREPKEFGQSKFRFLFWIPLGLLLLFSLVWLRRRLSKAR
jgi:hypothetical protein